MATIIVTPRRFIVTRTDSGYRVTTAASPGPRGATGGHTLHYTWFDFGGVFVSSSGGISWGPGELTINGDDANNTTVYDVFLPPVAGDQYKLFKLTDSDNYILLQCTSAVYTTTVEPGGARYDITVSLVADNSDFTYGDAIGFSVTRKGAAGATGATGATGAAGVGVPTGGTAGQALVKASNTNFDTTWTSIVTAPGGSTTQLQYNNAGAFGGAAASAYSTSSPHFLLTAQGTTIVPLAIRPQSGQTSLLIEYQNASGVYLMGVGTQSTSSADPYALHFRPGGVAGRSYYLTTQEAAGAFRFHRSDTAGFVAIVPNSGQINLAGAGSFSYLSGANTNMVLTAQESGAATTIDFNRRPADNSTAVGGTVRCWTKTSQITNAFEVTNPGGASYVFAIEADGDIRTGQTAAGTTLGAVARKWPIYNIAGTLLGYIPLYDNIT